ncbi:MAG: hypothetical protein GY841_10850 [FCB group bacterium]|nr:hypothetical protein [FCB group bacterium]
MGIKSLAARIYLNRLSARLDSTPLSLPLHLKGKSLLVLLPASQRDLTVVKQVLPEITQLFGDDSVFLLACPQTNVRSIFPSKGFHIITPGKSAMNWCQLPARTFLEKLEKRNFDYVFDTNLDENRFAARILLSFPEAVRFGCQGKLGLPYLNLEVKTKFLRDRRLIYRSILEVVANISRSNGQAAS